MHPVIIEVALNGETTREWNPHVPITAAEIAADALACIEAGASIIHAHCNPVGGSTAEVAQRYLDAFRPIWHERPDALLYPTPNFAGGVKRHRNDPLLSFAHLEILAEHGLRIGVFDPGTLNVGPTDEMGLPTGDDVYENTMNSVATMFALHAKLRLGISLAIFEPGFLRTTLCWYRAGRLPAGSMVKLYLSAAGSARRAPFGLPPTSTALAAYLELLDGCTLPWAVSAIEDDIVASEVAPVALDRGGHLHLGLEFYGGDRTPTNVELVREAVALCQVVGRPVATCSQAADILKLPRPAINA